MSRTICSFRLSKSDFRSFFNAATVAAAAGSAKTPATWARVRWAASISSSVTVSEKPPLSRTAFLAICALEGIETEMESAMVAG